MSNAIIQQGKFTSDGNAKILQLRSDVDWIRVYNYNNIGGSANPGQAYEFYWQRGMDDGDALRTYNTDGAATLEMDKLGSGGGGFTLVDSSDQSVTILSNLITNIATGAPPRVTLAAHGLVTGDIVRIVNATGALQLGGIDFHVTRVDANNFDLTYMPSIAAAAAPGANAKVYKVANEGFFVPKSRVITKVDVSTPTAPIFTFAAPHDFKAGNVVKFTVPRLDGTYWGMTQLDGVEAVISAVSTADNTITLDYDVSGFGTFAFPLTANSPFTAAQCEIVGQDTAYSLNQSPKLDVLGDVVYNNAYIGLKLGSGDNGPAGASGDVMYWVAGKSFSVSNS